MCRVQSRLAAEETAAVSAYRSAVARMKAVRGMEFERAWRLTEIRRQSLQHAQQRLRQHEHEHLCDSTQSARSHLVRSVPA
jgi:hypothetical protein